MRIATKRSLTTAFTIAVMGIIIAQIIVWTAPQAKNKAAEEKKVSVQTITLKPQNITALIETTGTAQVSQDSEISAQVSGKIIYVNPILKPGAIVKQDDILFKIERDDYEAALKEAGASLQSAESDLAIEFGSQEVAKKELKISGRKLTLMQESLTLREPQLKAAQASVTNAQAALQKAQMNLERTVIKAPFDSIVANTPVSLGTIATTGTTLVELVDNTNFWILAEVDTHLLKYINFSNKDKEGSEVTITTLSDKEGIQYEGVVKSLLPKTDDASKRPIVLVEFTLEPNQTQTIFDGDIVALTIKGKMIENAYKLPWELLKNSKEVWLYKNGVLEIKDVDIIHKNSSEIIVSGLSPKDEIVTTSIGGAKNGLKLQKVTNAGK
ncbi:MAG: efflux RND transporter periplasmic adaptor subunit [Campylobacterales bacterium]|nr:efflux RND transporter periplasmic adaptor subunit [Campylobacterales bacterium]